jgi:ribosomal protein L24E
MVRSGSGLGKRVLAVVVSTAALSGYFVLALSGPAGADTVTFTSGQIGSSGNTPNFSQGGPWIMSWSYNCAAYGNPGNFIVTVNQPANDLADDSGTNELGTSGSGTDYYYDTGQFSLAINSECDWSITVAPTSAGALATPTTFTSTQSGTTGDPQEFRVSSSWTMTWSYNCANYWSAGNFIVNIVQPAGDDAFDVGPNELGTSGTGTDSYNDTGVFSLDINSECDWTITVLSAGQTLPPPAASTAVGIAATPDGDGYWIAYSNGAVHDHGDAGSYGGLQGQSLNAPINHIVSTPDGKGYWLVAADGGIFTFGDAGFFGSTGAQHLNAPVVDMAPTPDGKGYWLVATDGGIFTFGDAGFQGSTGNLKLNKPVVGMAPTPDGKGYWLVASDGGIFAFGDAPFYGSTGNVQLNKPVNGMAPTHDGHGYWFVASDGGIFSFGDAQFHGSAGNIHLNAPIVGMAADNATGGYWLLGSDGGIFTEGAPFYGAD